MGLPQECKGTINENSHKMVAIDVAIGILKHSVEIPAEEIKELIR